VIAWWAVNSVKKYTTAICQSKTHLDTYASGRPILLCLSSGDFCRRWVLEESPDAACYVALEAASDLAIGLAFGA